MVSFGRDMTGKTQAADGISVRRATGADAERLARLGAETFTETFGHLYPPSDLAIFLSDHHTPEEYGAWIADPAFAVWIAEQDGRAVGYAVAGSCHLPHPEVTPDCGELRRLYVRKETQGSGLGGRLLAQALNWLEQPGRRLWLGVWSENHGAQRLYARHGFSEVGEYGFMVGRTRDRDLVFARPIP